MTASASTGEVDNGWVSIYTARPLDVKAQWNIKEAGWSLSLVVSIMSTRVNCENRGWIDPPQPKGYA
jgi:hypothetical protein